MSESDVHPWSFDRCLRPAGHTGSHSGAKGHWSYDGGIKADPFDPFNRVREKMERIKATLPITCDDCGLRWVPDSVIGDKQCPQCCHVERLKVTWAKAQRIGELSSIRGRLVRELCEARDRLVIELCEARDRIAHLERELLASSATAAAKPATKPRTPWDPEGV